MAGAKQPNTKGVSSTDKENHPPKKTARTVSVGGLFRDSVYEARDALAPQPSGVAKRGGANVRFDTRLRRSKRAENHPLFRSFAG